MYIPASFRQSDRTEQFEFMRANSFGLLVSQDSEELVASHLPLLVDADAPPMGQLIGHLACANPQAQALSGGRVLVVFSGPHAYVSPTWYGKSPMVPTWNYLAVHAYGRCELIDDEAELLEVLARTVETYEREQVRPWSFAANDPYVHKLVKAIVGFRIVLDRIDAKWKLGQNHAPEVRASAAKALADSANADSREIARLMQATLAGQSL